MESAAVRQPLAASLVVRLTVSTCVLIVATCVVLSVVLVRRHLADIHEGLVERGAAIAGFVAREAELGVLSGDLAGLRRLGDVAHHNPDVIYCRFFDADGSLLASVGDGPALEARSMNTIDPGPAAVAPDVWEFRAPITTAPRPRTREQLLADAYEEPASSAPAASRQRVGSVALGVALGKVRRQARLAYVTAAAFTLVVAILSAVGAALLLHGTLRAVASAAALTEERSRLAELKVSFVTQASHEFRTPLSVILSCCNVLQRYGARMAPDEQRRRLGKIEGSVRHMTELLEDVLTLRHAESGRLACARQPTDTVALCEEILADVRTTAPPTHRLVLDAAGPLGGALLDAKLVRQVLRNLLVNAVKYSPAGGTVTLAVTRCDGALTFRIVDEGIGIGADDQARLFEPFHRGANVGVISGSGLGLAITRKAVQSHGGTIRVESNVGHGSVFVVTLPDGADEAGAFSLPREHCGHDA